MENLDATIALLGTYIALMAVLAVMVEAVISWLKIPKDSPIKGKPAPTDVLNEVKGWLGKGEEGLAEARITALNKALSSFDETKEELLSVTQDNKNLKKIAEKIGDVSTVYQKTEQRRRGLIRLLAIIFGIMFAALFQINTLEILSPVLGSTLDTLTNLFGDKFSTVLGIALSGLAASAGSSFWHDQSARLRGLKNTTASVNELMSKG